MCGIYGLVSPAGRPLAEIERASCLAARLRHRGPDGSGLLVRPHAALGVERLRVVDLDPRADQPFSDPADRVWVACNGEIYNAPELRRRYRHYPFRSQSDVEVIVPLYLDRGPDAIAELAGMFGLAIWDEARRRLVLARDRVGEKPLFYARLPEGVAFASEVQALLDCLAISRELDRTAVAAFLLLGYLPEPRTMFCAIRQVPAGAMVVVEPSGWRTIRYFDPSGCAESARGDAAVPLPATIRRLRQVLAAAVTRQLRSDVPVGVFTSGGVDSSLLVALARQALGPERLHTFTARFRAPSYDESAFARALARRLGTRHLEVPVGEPELAQAFDQVTSRIAQPIADPAVLPTWLLARAARERVTVVLAGEGADELFGGYPTYLGHRLAPGFARWPGGLRRALAAALARLPDSSAKVPLRALLKEFMAAADRPWVERHLRWFGSGIPPQALRLPVPPVEECWSIPPGAGAVAGAMLVDFTSYLRDRLLVKLDRATMLVALEARSPYLDREVVEFALGLSPDLKVQGFETKWLLKRAAAAWLPARIRRRRKRGLSVPIAAWLRQGFRAEAQRLLEPQRLRRQGWLSDVSVSRWWEEHLAGRTDHARRLWTVIVLQRWLEHWAPEESNR